MPHRPAQHKIADQAVTAVALIWSKVGAAVEVVHQDYGDDLLVQTCLRGGMDASRIWVQVKGTADAADLHGDKGQRRIRIGNSLALRWARTADMVVVVLWDVVHDVGWYTTVGSDVDQLAMMEDPGGDTVVTVRSLDTFDTRSADLLSWSARFRHADRLLASYITGAEEMEESGESGEHHRKAAVAILISAMLDMGILQKAADESPQFSVSQHFRDQVGAALRDDRDLNERGGRGRTCQSGGRRSAENGQRPDRSDTTPQDRRVCSASAHPSRQPGWNRDSQSRRARLSTCGGRTS